MYVLCIILHEEIPMIHDHRMFYVGCLAHCTAK